MLKTTLNSLSRKTTGCHVTHRAGRGEMYKTCPTTCTLNPTRRGSRKIDSEYLAGLARAVPKNGHSFTYSHFDPRHWHRFDGINERPDRTVINWSLDGLPAALEQLPRIVKQQIPTVVVVAESPPPGELPTREKKRFVRCPAETQPITCGGGIDANGRATRPCGNCRPLCARGYADRNGIVVVFTAHGAGRLAAAEPLTRGGCYASYHHTARQWEKTAKAAAPLESDGVQLLRWIREIDRGYPRGGQIVRHHVAGDIGRD